MLSLETLKIARAMVHRDVLFSSRCPNNEPALKEIDAEIESRTSASTDCNQHAKERVEELSTDEAAEKYSTGYGHGTTIPKQLHRDICNGIEFIQRTAFQAGAEWANTRPAPEVLGERWVIILPGAPIELCTHRFYEDEPAIMQGEFDLGYRAVKVKIVREGE